MNLAGTYNLPNVTLDSVGNIVNINDELYSVMDCGYFPINSDSTIVFSPSCAVATSVGNPTANQGALSSAISTNFAPLIFCQPIWFGTSVAEQSLCGVAPNFVSYATSTGNNYNDNPPGFTNYVASGTDNGAYWGVISNKMLMPQLSQSVNNFNPTQIIAYGAGIDLNGTTSQTLTFQVTSNSSISNIPNSGSTLLGAAIMLSTSSNNNLNLSSTMSIEVDSTVGSLTTWNVSVSIVHSLNEAGTFNYVVFAPKSLGFNPLPNTFISYAGAMLPNIPYVTPDYWTPTPCLDVANSSVFITPIAANNNNVTPYYCQIVYNNAQVNLSGSWPNISTNNIPGIVASNVADSSKNRTGCYYFTITSYAS